MVLITKIKQARAYQRRLDLLEALTMLSRHVRTRLLISCLARCGASRPACLTASTRVSLAGYEIYSATSGYYYINKSNPRY